MLALHTSEPEIDSAPKKDNHTGAKTQGTFHLVRSFHYLLNYVTLQSLKDLKSSSSKPLTRWRESQLSTPFHANSNASYPYSHSPSLQPAFSGLLPFQKFYYATSKNLTRVLFHKVSFRWLFSLTSPFSVHLLQDLSHSWPVTHNRSPINNASKPELQILHNLFDSKTPTILCPKALARAQFFKPGFDPAFKKTTGK